MLGLDVGAGFMVDAVAGRVRVMKLSVLDGWGGLVPAAESLGGGGASKVSLVGFWQF